MIMRPTRQLWEKSASRLLRLPECGSLSGMRAIVGSPCLNLTICFLTNFYECQICLRLFVFEIPRSNYEFFRFLLNRKLICWDLQPNWLVWLLPDALYIDDRQSKIALASDEVKIGQQFGLLSIIRDCALGDNIRPLVTWCLVWDWACADTKVHMLKLTFFGFEKFKVL